MKNDEDPFAPPSPLGDCVTTERLGERQSGSLPTGRQAKL